MKIAYLTNQYPLVSHTFIRREICALEEQGLEVERFSIRETQRGTVDAADVAEAGRTQVLLRGGARGLLWGVLRHGSGRPWEMSRALSLALRLGWRSERGLLRHLVYLAEACVLQERLADRGTEHLHVHFGTNSATVAVLCRELGGPPFSFTVHGPEEFDKPALIGLPEKIRRAAGVVAISSFGRSQLYRLCPVEEWSKIHVVRCGVDESYLLEEPPPVPDEPRLVCVGRLCEQKGQLLLVDAVAELKRQGLPFELILVGDGEMRGEIEARIRSHRLEDQVRITGWAQGVEVQRYLQEARALVLPSFAEGLPVVIMEALALGRPVVTTYIAGIPELVDQECGWLVPAGSLEHLVEALRQVLAASPKKLSRLGRVGRQRVAEMHDVRRNAQLLLETVFGSTS